MRVIFFTLVFMMQAINDVFPQTTDLSEKIAQLPLKEFFSDGNSDYFIILFTGDGGWKSLALDMAGFFQNKKIPFVGLDVRKYFWTKRSQPEITDALDIIIKHYSAIWHKNKVVLIGYSFGAEVLPFAAAELNAGIKTNIEKVILIAPGQFTELEVTIGSLLDFSSDGLPLAPELEKIQPGSFFIVCDDSEDALCNKLDNKYDCYILKGGHHFDGDFHDLDLLIWNKLNNQRQN
jgi:type IV secretory pathway VirJ component